MDKDIRIEGLVNCLDWRGIGIRKIFRSSINELGRMWNLGYRFLDVLLKAG